MKETPEKMLEDIKSAVKATSKRGGIELSAWEEDFIENISNRVSSNSRLSEKQIAVIQKIWDKI